MRLLETWREVARGLHLTLRFFLAASAVVLAYILAFPYPEMLPFAHGLLLLVLVATLVDTFMLFPLRGGFSAQRDVP